MYVILLIIILIMYTLPTYQKPRILSNILTEEECDYIIEKSKNILTRSTVGKEHSIDSTRISETAWLDLEDPVVRKIAKRCLNNTDRPIKNCEKLQVVRYKDNGYYHVHQDATPGDKNKRMYTFILGLNDGYDGGETEFPNINMKFKLKKGDCLMFDNLDNYNLMTSQALHSGNKVISGEKWIANLWVHVHPYNN